jgi:hypothetical protein
MIEATSDKESIEARYFRSQDDSDALIMNHSSHRDPSFGKEVNSPDSEMRGLHMKMVRIFSLIRQVSGYMLLK